MTGGKQILQETHYSLNPEQVVALSMYHRNWPHTIHIITHYPNNTTEPTTKPIIQPFLL